MNSSSPSSSSSFCAFPAAIFLLDYAFFWVFGGFWWYFWFTSWQNLSTMDYSFRVAQSTDEAAVDFRRGWVACRDASLFCSSVPASSFYSSSFLSFWINSSRKESFTPLAASSLTLVAFEKPKFYIFALRSVAAAPFVDYRALFAQKLNYFFGAFWSFLKPKSRSCSGK